MSLDYDEYLKDFKNLLTDNRLPNTSKVWSPIVAYRRDKYLTPEELKLNVLNSRRVHQVLDEMSDNDSKSKARLLLTVREMLNEIGLAKSLPVIRWLGVCISAVIKRICTEVYINEKSMERIKQTVGNNPVLYLPSHRSYADFILMSYLFFTYDIEIPSIAAGMDFHGMIGMGSALRKTGAFFIRRSFVNDKLYWYVFKEYIHSLMTIYHTGIEFFLEGTRSRSCKALMPKIGLLSMALEPLFMGEIPDVTIVPVSVSYEKPLEEQLFVYELLGIPKPKESTLGLLKSLSIIDQSFGSIYFDLGEPISVKKYFNNKLDRFNHSMEPHYVQNLTKEELNMTTDLAHEVILKQQNFIVISSFNLISLCYNTRSYLGKSTSVSDLIEELPRIVSLFRSLGAIVAVDCNKMEDTITKAISLHKNVFVETTSGGIETVQPSINLERVDRTKLKGHNLSEITMKRCIPSFTLQLYNNPCMHWLHQPAFIILVCKDLSQNGEFTIRLSEVRDLVRRLRELFIQEFVIYSEREENEFFTSLDHLIKLNIIELEENQIKFHRTSDNINLMLSSIAPFLCCYLQVSKTILKKYSSEYFVEKEFLVSVQENVENDLLKKQDYLHPYCLCLDSISLALAAFSTSGCVEKTKRNSENTYKAIEENLTRTRDLLQKYCRLLPFNYLQDNNSQSKL